ncbi:methyltransferase domain-containing protein [Arthrobacter sp. U41]|uniref:class I SAM-dependent methyltransferase n=1 Tax=Arthrobacter sp. U41 TaxID=1849032 RepID=UPI0028D015E1|nr:methyltransferase domain-containing protein [Arthrobacter sp. U41]
MRDRQLVRAAGGGGAPHQGPGPLRPDGCSRPCQGRRCASAGLPAVEFLQGDASEPPYLPASCDVVLVRHVLWALPDPDDALGRWTRLLRTPGTMLLVEGLWGTGAGIASGTCRELVLRHRSRADVVPLTDPSLWGKEISDERYLVISRS